MPIKLPQSTSPAEIEKVVSILGPKVTGLSITDAKKIDSRLFEEDTIHTCMFIGLIESYDGKIKLTTSAGREYHKAADVGNKKSILRERLRQIPIYDRTIEYFYHGENFTPTKVDIAAYWHENFLNELEEMSEDDLTNAAIFFIRFLEFADLGQYVQAGRGRDTHSRLDQVKVAEYITSAEATPETIKKYQEEVSKEAPKEENPNQINQETFSQISSSSAVLSSSNIRAIQRLQFELTDKELDSPGAKKLILDMLDRFEKENTVLKAKVESYKDVEKTAAILESEVRSLTKLNLLKTSVNSIGGVILGMSLSLTQSIQQYVAAGLGIALIIISIALRDQPENPGKE
jgi:hypothetical protein